MNPTRALIHLDNLEHNLRLVKERCQKQKICAAVKADAYGHGAIECSHALLRAGADFLAVAHVDEAQQLRQHGIKAPILLLGICPPEDLKALIKLNIRPLVTDAESIDKLEKCLSSARAKFPVHLKIDTGMGRIGCAQGDALNLAGKISSSSKLILEGCCSHFPAADRDSDQFTINQIKRFKKIIQSLRDAGIDPGIVHAANSGAIIAYPEAWFDMVRPGIMLYGYYPSTEQKRPLNLRPVMELESRISFLKKVGPNTPISYGLNYHTQKESWIATVAAGYGDGYPRLLSGKAEVLAGGKRYPAAGNICMDQFMLDLGPACPLKRWDRVVLFGPDPAGPDAEEIAEKIATIPYEICCMVNQRVQRVYMSRNA